MKKIPKMTLKKGYYYVRLKGRDYYLGKVESAARAKYLKIVGEALVAESKTPAAPSELLVSDVLHVYLEQMSRYAAKKTIESNLYHTRIIVKYCPKMPASGLDSVRLIQLQERLAPTHCKDVIKNILSFVKSAYRHAAAIGIIRPEVYQSVMLVQLIRGLHSHPPVEPVEISHAERVLSSIPDIDIRNAAMLVLYGGMRPSEVLKMEWQHIKTIGTVWQYTLPSHKTQNRTRKPKIKYLGSRCQQILKAYEGVDGKLFPTTTERQIWAAITRQSEKLGNRFTPYQLRHTAGTESRRLLGLEASQAFLGHDSRNTTERYAAPVEEKAIEIAKRFG